MTPTELKVALDTVWVMVAAFLVFWMNAGFGLVEAGLCRRKNAVTILSKNFVVFAISTLAFWVVGFGLMFSDGQWVGSAGGLFLTGVDNSPATGQPYRGIFPSLNWTGVPLHAKFFFQLVFCGTAATIVSGAVNERTRYGAFLVFAVHPDRRSSTRWPGTGSGAAASWPASVSWTSPDRPWFTAWAAGRRWPASW